MSLCYLPPLLRGHSAWGQRTIALFGKLRGCLSSIKPLLPTSPIKGPLGAHSRGRGHSNYFLSRDDSFTPAGHEG